MQYTSKQYYNISIISALIAIALAVFYNRKKTLSKDQAMIYQIAIALAAVIAIASYYYYTKMSEKFEETKVSKTYRIGDILQRFRVRERLHAADVNLKQVAKMIHESNYDIDRVIDGVKDYEITISAPAAQHQEVIVPVQVDEVVVVPIEEQAVESNSEKYCGCSRGEGYIPSLRKTVTAPIKKLQGSKY